MNNITVFLTDEDAKLFVTFQKRHELVSLMDKAGAFDIHDGSVTINFDSSGFPRTIETKRHFRVESYPQVDRNILKGDN